MDSEVGAIDAPEETFVPFTPKSVADIASLEWFSDSRSLQFRLNAGHQILGDVESRGLCRVTTLQDVCTLTANLLTEDFAQYPLESRVRFVQKRLKGLGISVSSTQDASLGPWTPLHILLAFFERYHEKPLQRVEVGTSTLVVLA